MSGNASYRLANTTVLSVCAVEAPVVVTSAAFDERLTESYEREGLRAGMLEELAGVRERRWWPEDVSFADAAAMAGAKALAEAGITPEQIGVMINTSVSRAYLEPSTAVAVHHQLGLPTSCLNFDLANACLGFVNGIQLAGTMIDSGQATTRCSSTPRAPGTPRRSPCPGWPGRTRRPTTSGPSSPR